MPENAKQVLTIVGTGDSHLSEDLTAVGYKTLTAQSMWTATSAMRSDRFAAVVIDLFNIDDDILELVLTIRDANNVIPILIVGEPTDVRVARVLDMRTRVYRIAETDREHIRQKTEEITAQA